MTNGSSSGSVSSSSSARAMRIGHEVGKAQFATPPLQGALILELQEARDEAVGRVEDQLVERALRARAVRRRILAQRKLKEGVKLNGTTATSRILDEDATGLNIPRPAQFRHYQPRARARGGNAASAWGSVQDPQVAVAQIPAPIRDAGKSCNGCSGASLDAGAGDGVVRVRPPWRTGAVTFGGWYFPDHTASTRPGRVRSPPARTSAR